jgi:hypothetical protein
MLGLQLREEFKGKRLRGTAIELSNEAATGATQIASQDFLRITYPTLDLLKAIEAAGPEQGRPIVVIGERGLGKSHLLAVLHHVASDPASAETWLQSWASTLHKPEIGQIALRKGALVIGESLHRQRYKFLWDLLFEKHPHGNYIRGKWEGMGDQKTDIPSDKLILELLRHTPTVLLLDEFQTWYDGLTNTKQFPWRNWAFNFIQVLSEIAKEHPELLVLVVSVRNGGSDAYQQIHRVNPVAIDFKAGGSPERIQQDRRRMLLHRLFENRMQISDEAVEKLTAKHIEEYFRLLAVPPSEHERKRNEFAECWPFAPHLLQLLEDQVLVATDAQETRDLIRILANLFKSHGEQAPLLTAGDFRLDDDATGIGALLDSVANEHHRALRDKALRNLTSVNEAVADHKTSLPHLEELIGALWLRSIAVSNLAGAEPAALQADITRNRRVDDNAFQVELAAIVDNSFNIHKVGSRLVFLEEENSESKLKAHARNDRLFTDESDLVQLAKEIRYALGGSESGAGKLRVIALPKSWISDPWSALEETEHPDHWDERLNILVLPEAPDRLNERLGRWLKDHLQRRRNAVRFLLPRQGSQNIFMDRDVVILNRVSMMAQQWGAQSPDFTRLHKKYQTELRDLLKRRFDRFAVLRSWSFGDPTQSVFEIEAVPNATGNIPESIEEKIANDLFVPEDFEELVLEAASESASLGKLLRELQEPRPGGKDCVPWLGETEIKERILKLCAAGKIAINQRGMEYLQALSGEDEATAWRRLRSKLPYTGRQLDEVLLLKPGAVPATGGGGGPPSFVQAPTTAVGGLFDGTVGPGNSNVPAPNSSDGSASPPDNVSNIFSGQENTRSRVKLVNPPTSPLNLIGKLESWGVGPATAVGEVTLKITSATGAQVKDMLRKLPDGMTFELSLEKEEL